MRPRVRPPGRKPSSSHTGETPQSFAVTTKSNGENGKFAVRAVGEQLYLFAGSKNTCLVWLEETDVRMMHPPTNGRVPGPAIAAAVQQLWRGMSDVIRSAFVANKLGLCTCMLEFNCSHHEHVFPIASDYIDFVAILDEHGLTLPQREAFALFDEFGMPRVHCASDLPMSELAVTLAAERAATDREGAVLYLETKAGRPVGLLKVKSSYYVKARRTREIVWNTIVDPLLRGESQGLVTLSSATSASVSNSASTAAANVTSKMAGKQVARRGRVGWEVAEQRMRSGMRGLNHVDGCNEHWMEWGDEAVGFVRWWRKRFDALRGEEAVLHALGCEARNKFGSVYRDYCRDAGLPGGGEQVASKLAFAHDVSINHICAWGFVCVFV